jgi:hypothetical protein
MVGAVQIGHEISTSTKLRVTYDQAMNSPERELCRIAVKENVKMVRKQKPVDRIEIPKGS